MGKSKIMVCIKRNTVRDALDAVFHIGGGDRLRQTILDEKGRIGADFRLLVNSRFIKKGIDPLSRVLEDGDTLSIFPQVAGG